MKKILILTLMAMSFSGQAMAEDYNLYLRGGGGLGFSDWNKSTESHDSSYMFFGGVKPSVTLGKWDLSLAVDFLKYKIKNDLNTAKYISAEHENDNILFSLSPKYKFTDKFQMGPYVGQFKDKNVISIDTYSKYVAGLEADYKLNDRWMVSAALEHSTDSSSYHRMAKLSIAYNLFGSEKKKEMPRQEIPKRVCMKKHLTVYFAFDSDKLSKKEQEKLEKYLESEEGALYVEGHTDQVGTDAYNEKLSERRANTVAKFLKDRGYQVKDKLFFGERKPVSKHGRENRRVEIQDCE